MSDNPYKSIFTMPGTDSVVVPAEVDSDLFRLKPTQYQAKVAADDAADDTWKKNFSDNWKDYFDTKWKIFDEYKWDSYGTNFLDNIVKRYMEGKLQRSLDRWEKVFKKKPDHTTHNRCPIPDDNGNPKYGILGCDMGKYNYGYLEGTKTKLGVNYVNWSYSFKSNKPEITDLSKKECKIPFTVKIKLLHNKPFYVIKNDKICVGITNGLATYRAKRVDEQEGEIARFHEYGHNRIAEYIFGEVGRQITIPASVKRAFSGNNDTQIIENAEIWLERNSGEIDELIKQMAKTELEERFDDIHTKYYHILCGDNGNPWDGRWNMCD